MGFSDPILVEYSALRYSTEIQAAAGPVQGGRVQYPTETISGERPARAADETRPWGNSLTGRTPLDYRAETHMQTFFFAYQHPA
jgi:hypothetical protein